MLFQVKNYFLREREILQLTDELGMVGVGGLFIMGGGYLPHTFPQVLGAVSVLLASVNISGGFVITKRMLDMFKRMVSQYTFQTKILTELYRPDRPSRVSLVICNSCYSVWRWLHCRCDDWYGWSGSSWVSDKQSSLHR